MATSVQRLKVQSVDRGTGTVQVTLPSGGTAFIPAPAAVYATDAWVVMDGSQPLYALGPVTTGDGYARGTVASTAGGNAVVNVDEGDQVTVPLISGTYSGGDRLWLLQDAWGAPVMGAEWLSSSGTETKKPTAGSGSAASDGGSGSSLRPAREARQFGPSSVGTYRYSKSAWNNWQPGRFGFPAVAYQGSKYGSGSLVGVFAFGDQIVGLGATSIDSAVITLRRSDGDGGIAAPVAVGVSTGVAGGGAPVGVTGTYGGSGAGGGGGSSIVLGSDVCSALRTGAVKGIGLVGGTYSAWVGATLTLNITRMV